MLCDIEWGIEDWNAAVGLVVENSIMQKDVVWMGSFMIPAWRWW